MEEMIIHTNSDNFENDVLKSDLPVVVAFYSEDCPPCAPFINIFKRSSEIYSEHMRFVMIHRQQNRQLAESLNIKSSPTVLFFKDGEELCFRLNGYITILSLKRVLRMLLVENAKERKKKFIAMYWYLVEVRLVYLRRYIHQERRSSQ